MLWFSRKKRPPTPEEVEQTTMPQATVLKLARNKQTSDDVKALLKELIEKKEQRNAD